MRLKRWRQKRILKMYKNKKLYRILKMYKNKKLYRILKMLRKQKLYRILKLYKNLSLYKTYKMLKKQSLNKTFKISKISKRQRHSKMLMNLIRKNWNPLIFIRILNLLSIPLKFLRAIRITLCIKPQLKTSLTTTLIRLQLKRQINQAQSNCLKGLRSMPLIYLRS